MKPLFILTIFVTIYVSLSKPSPHKGDGFSVELIHIDSPLSPLYNPSLSLTDHNQNAFRRSISRALRMAKSQSKVYAWDNSCCYQNSDADSYYTEGVLARDTFSIGPTPYKQVLFGCAHYYEDLQYFTPNVSGRIGLGRGPLSQVSQLKPVIQGKFSYCLMPLNSSKPSKIYFGEHVNMPGPNVVSTTLITIDYSTLYAIRLTDVLVGNKSVLSYNHNRNQSYIEKGNMVIDIDIVTALFPRDLYDPFIASMTKSHTCKAHPKPTYYRL
ncbi:aspartic proteinase CDR1-like [Bidens hawaiensis]|uniref:aspartic proteinase CDR1-like n=1 Tax=Bidens hawaiensis TaxID=980011 RepID=UPI004049DE3E